MKAFTIKGFGGTEVFQPMDVAKPSARPGHVVVRAAATSVNPIDYKIRRGDYAQIAPDAPTILHGDIAGTVTEVGAGVTQFKVGDEVYGCAGGVKGYAGALAEYMLADAQLLAHKPRTLSMQQAAALPLVAITAWEALVERSKVQAGQSVLIHAGAGGVGHIAIQLAKARGARVFATTSTPAKQQIVRDLGADGVIDYRHEAVADYVDKYTQGQGFDMVFDTVGGETFTRSLAAARMYGQVVSILPTATYDLSPLLQKSLTVHGIFMMLPLLTGHGRAAHGKLLDEIAQLVNADRIRPLIDAQTFQFADIAQAHAHAESGKQIGKVVVALT